MSDTMLVCPKCQDGMETLERSGVVIEQCNGCRGVFLDRGELERLIDAESQYLASLPAVTVPEADRGGYHGRHRRGIIREIFDGAPPA